MLRNLLICGLVCGLCAGLVATGFAALAAEPAIDRAIAFERAHEGGGGAQEVAPVSRATQKTVGLATAAVVYGVALGGLFALAFAFAYGRVGRAAPRHAAYWLAVGAFVVVYLVPFLKYPANPPAIGEPATIGLRTQLYAVMLAISVAAAVAAARLRAALAGRWAGDVATGGALALYVVLVASAALALPGVHEVPADFPATVLWRFREASIGAQALLWTTLGLTFGYAAPRVMLGQPVLHRARSRPVVAAED